MTVQENTNIQIAHAIHEAWNANDMGQLREVLSSDFQAEEPGMSPLSGEQFIAYKQNFLTAFPGSKMEALLDIFQGDYVVTHWKVSGVHTGPLHTSLVHTPTR